MNTNSIYPNTVLLPGLFVDVGENRSVLDAKDLVYLFDEIGTAERTMEDRFEEVC